MIRNWTFLAPLSLPVVLALTACAPTADAPNTTASAPVFKQFDLGPAYMSEPLPGGLGLAPPPPAEGAAALAIDKAASAAGLTLQNTARFALAGRDADLSTGAVPRAFSCAAGVAISDANTPAIAHLLRRAGGDFGSSTSGVKDTYKRPRPFVVNNQPTCSPQDEKFLRTNGSYPSGHSAIGSGTALVLAAIFPERTAELVARGRSYDDSRRVCNVHWHSDIQVGALFGAATFARLQSDPTFRADLAKAQAEAKALASNPPLPDAAACAEEAAALAMG